VIRPAQFVRGRKVERPINLASVQAIGLHCLHDCEISYKRDPTRNAVHIIDHTKEFRTWGVTFRA
jgi:hypothetical protein